MPRSTGAAGSPASTNGDVVEHDRAGDESSGFAPGGERTSRIAYRKPVPESRTACTGSAISTVARRSGETAPLNVATGRPGK